MTHPKLERFRAKIPYPIVIGFLALLMATVFIIVHGLLDWISGTFDPNILWCYEVVAIFPVIYTILAVIGRASGYRAFVSRWENLSPEQVLKIQNAIASATPEAGFQICWQKPLAGFVAVLNYELEKKYVNDGTNFPTRLSIFFHNDGSDHFKAVMKIGVRTLCFWDSGECENCARFRKYFAEVLKLEDVALYPTQMPGNS